MATMTAVESPRVYFLHIPKTSGRATALYLEAQFRAGEVCPARTGPEIDRLGPAALCRYRLFHGDLGASVLGRLPADTAIVTFAREPMERAISHWKMVLRTPIHHRHADLVANGSSFEWFLRTMAANPMTRLLSALDDGPYDEPRNLANWNEAERVDRAIARLESCAVVGLTRCHDDSIALLAARFGWAPPVTLPRINAAPASQPAYEPTPRECELFAERNAADVAVYPRAVELFERRRRLIDPDLVRRLHEGRLAAAGTDLAAPLVVDVGAHAPGAGWLPPTRVHDTLARGIGAGGVATLDLPVRLPPSSAIEVRCPLVGDVGDIESLAVEVDGAPVAVSARREPEAVVLHGVVPHTTRRAGFTRIRLRAASTCATRIGLATSESVIDLSVGVATVTLLPVQRAGHVATAPGGNPC
jgi:hypothetical protein